MSRTFLYCYIIFVILKLSLYYVWLFLSNCIATVIDDRYGVDVDSYGGMCWCLYAPVLFLNYYFAFFSKQSYHSLCHHISWGYLNLLGFLLIHPDLFLVIVAYICVCMLGVWVCSLLFLFWHVSFLSCQFNLPGDSTDNSSMCGVIITRLSPIVSGFFGLSCWYSFI